MAWKINYTEIALKQMKKLNKNTSRQIDDYLNLRVAKQKDPRVFGKPLLVDKTGLWRFRVENFRIICQIQDKELIVLALQLGHRKSIYR